MDPADLAKGSTDFRHLLTQNHAGTDTVAKFSASFKDEADLKSVLAKDFSIEPEASLASEQGIGCCLCCCLEGRPG